jgi:hypothetical protein
MHGHGVIFSASNHDQADPEDEAKTRAVVDALKRRIPMPFRNETPLGDALDYIKEQTKGQELPDGIPIYVDPIGLNEAEKTMTSPITFDVKGVALRESLRLMLKQLGLLYTVKDGLLSITSESSEDAPSPIVMLAEKAEMGELSLSEMNELLEFFKARRQVSHYAAGEEVQVPAAAVGGGVTPGGSGRASSDGEEDPRTMLILDALEKYVPLHFVGENLDVALAQIKKATAGPGFPEGIPIYRNPRAMQGSHSSMVTIDLNGVRLKTSLRLLLAQLGLGCAVRDGLLIIDNQNSPEVAPSGAGIDRRARGLQ